MSEFLKNTASQSKFVTVIDSASGAGKESGVSFTYTAAGGSQTALSGTATHKGNGQYEIIPTQTETNVDCFCIGWYGFGVVPNCVTIFTTTKRLRDLQDLAAGGAMTLTEAGILAIWHQLMTGITTAGTVGKLIKDYLDAAITSRGTLTAAQVRTELATELARILKAMPDAVPGTNGGLPTTNGSKLNQTSDLTAGQSIACSDKSGFGLSATGLDLITAPASGSALKAIQDKTAALPEAPAAVGSQMNLADNAVTSSKIAATALNGKGDWNTVAPSTPSNVSNAQTAIINAIAALNNLSSAQVTAAVPTAAAIITALKASVGWTRGGTWTLAEVVCLLAAMCGLKVIDKTGEEGTRQFLDAEDLTTPVAEGQISETTPYTRVTKL